MGNVSDEATIIRQLLSLYLPLLAAGGSGGGEPLDFSNLPDLGYTLQTTDETLVNRAGALSKASIDAIAFYMLDFLLGEGFVQNSEPVAELRLKAEGFNGTGYFKLQLAGVGPVDSFGIDNNYGSATSTPLLVRFDGGMKQIEVGTAGGIPGLPADARALYISNGGVGPAVAGPVISVGPSDHGLIAWTQDPATVTGTIALGAGQIWLQRVKATVSGPASNIHVDVQAVGAGLVSGQNFAALYSTAGERLGVTADQTASWGSVGNKSMALTAPAAVVAGTSYYVALLSNGTTPPTVRRSTAVASLINFNLTAAGPRFALSGSGNTSMPANIVVSGYTLATNGVFCGVS